MIFPGGLEDDEDGMSQDQLLVMAQQRGLDLHQNVICQQDVIQSDQKLAQVTSGQFNIYLCLPKLDFI